MDTKVVYEERDFFIVLDDVIGGRITGVKEDTFTVFHATGKNVHYHCGTEKAREIKQRVAREIRNMRYEGVSRVPPQLPTKKFDKDW
jgi:hypothetical protein